LDALAHSDADPEVRAQLAQVYATLRLVNVEQRICWVLRFVEGRKLEEVAALSGCSLATAKRRIFAVQERLLRKELSLSEEELTVASAKEKDGGKS
jgi:RNA polymerase sigma-70 factor (ECF subfamily)